jgi:hypothetical protein
MKGHSQKRRDCLKLYECHEMDQNGQRFLVVCIAVNRKEAELKIHDRKWWQKTGIRATEEFR